MTNNGQDEALTSHQDLEGLMGENEELKKKVEKLLVENERLKNNTGAVKFEELLKEKLRLQKEVRILRERTEDLELECAAYVALKRELKKKESELNELRSILSHKGKGRGNVGGTTRSTIKNVGYRSGVSNTRRTYQNSISKANLHNSRSRAETKRRGLPQRSTSKLSSQKNLYKRKNSACKNLLIF